MARKFTPDDLAAIKSAMRTGASFAMPAPNPAPRFVRVGHNGGLDFNPDALSCVCVATTMGRDEHELVVGLKSHDKPFRIPGTKEECERWREMIVNPSMPKIAAQEQTTDEPWCHAACLSIAEGLPGWQNVSDLSPAIKAVKALRKEVEELRQRASQKCVHGKFRYANAPEVGPKSVTVHELDAEAMSEQIAASWSGVPSEPKPPPWATTQTMFTPEPSPEWAKVVEDDDAPTVVERKP
jgi:hypothetical protein